MNFSQSETDFIRDAEAYVPIAESDKPVVDSEDALKDLLEERRAAAAPGSMPDFMHTKFIGLDLAGWDMRNLNLRRATFDGCNLNGTDFSGSDLDHVAFYNNDLRYMKLCGCMA